MTTTASIKPNRIYLVQAVGEIVSSGSGGAMTVESWLRYTTDGNEPTTSSTALGRAESRNDSTVGVPRTVLVQGYYQSSTTATFTVGLFSQRVEGSVNAIWTAGTGRPVTLAITDIGPSLSQTGNYYTT